MAECCRTIRTNLLFMSPERPLKTLVVTSSGPREGKSTTVVNTAVTMAQSGSRVVIVDTDMRRPRLHKSFGLDNDVGVSSLLLGGADLDSAVRPTGVDRLDLLSCGPIPPNPAELLHTDRFAGLIRELALALRPRRPRLAAGGGGGRRAHPRDHGRRRRARHRVQAEAQAATPAAESRIVVAASPSQEQCSRVWSYLRRHIVVAPAVEAVVPMPRPVHANGPVQGSTCRADLGTHSSKRYSWPLYAAALRAKHRCPSCVLVPAQPPACSVADASSRHRLPAHR